MLDDLKYIHERDAQDALGIAEKQTQQLTYQFMVDTAIEPRGINNVVYAGMGGSALGALISTSWPGYSVPFEICRNYDIPAYVGENTLFIASSYSGNTEETLAALEAAGQKGAQIVVIAAGGRLKTIAEEKNYPFILLPQTSQPRYAALYGLKALLTVLEKTGLVSEKTMGELQPAADFLQESIKSWLPTVPTAKNYAKQLALECMGKSAVVYSGPKLFPAAYKWKISFNENAKNVAWCSQYPEFNHNEFIGWTSHPTQKPYAIIDLRSDLEQPRIQKRFEVSERLLSGKRPHTHIVKIEGDTVLKQLLWAVALGDFVSLYVALLNGLNPTPVDLIEKFKKALDE